LLDQLIDYWRDLMVVSCAGAEGRELSVSAKHRPTLARHAEALSVDTILAGLDILAATKARLRTSQHARVLLEMALVRLGRLGDLVSVTQLVQSLAQAPVAAPTGKPQPAKVEQPARKLRDEAPQLAAPPPAA